MPVLSGGKPIYGVPLGIIMLDCRFPRPLGDVGNAATFSFPVLYEILHEVPTSDLTVAGKPEAVQALVRSARRLEKAGVGGILTSCGLLIRYQSLLADSVGVPVATSAVLLLPFLGALISETQKIAIVLSTTGSLPPTVFRQIGWRDMDRVLLVGLDRCDSFTRSIMSQEPPYLMDTDEIYGELSCFLRSFLEQEKDIGALLLECTNLGPYSQRLRADFQLPVFDVKSLAYMMRYSVAFPGN
jgi:hypothetical protein